MYIQMEKGTTYFYIYVRSIRSPNKVFRIFPFKLPNPYALSVKVRL